MYKKVNFKRRARKINLNISHNNKILKHCVRMNFLAMNVNLEKKKNKYLIIKWTYLLMTNIQKVIIIILV